MFCAYCKSGNTEQVNFDETPREEIVITYHCNNCNRDYSEHYEYSDTTDEDDISIEF